MKISASIFKNYFAAVGHVFKKYRIIGFFLLILLALGYLGVVYYFYVLHSPDIQKAIVSKMSVNAEVFKRVTDNFNQRRINFENEASKSYIDPFK